MKCVCIILPILTGTIVFSPKILIQLENRLLLDHPRQHNWGYWMLLFVNFVTFCSGNGVNMVADRSLGTLAATKSMLFCISFINTLWRITLRPWLGVHVGKRFSKKWLLTLWYLIGVTSSSTSALLQRDDNKLSTTKMIILLLKSLWYSTLSPLFVNLMVMIVNLKKSICKYSTLQSFKLHYWWFSSKTGNLQVKEKSETNPNSNKNAKKNSRFLFTDLKGRRRHLVDLAFCLCSVSQALLNFLNQEPLEGNRKLKRINMSECGRWVSAFPCGCTLISCRFAYFLSFLELQRLNLKVQRRSWLKC